MGSALLFGVIEAWWSDFLAPAHRGCRAGSEAWQVGDLKGV